MKKMKCCEYGFWFVNSLLNVALLLVVELFVAAPNDLPAEVFLKTMCRLGPSP
jgi:hypothetical protein